MDLSPDSRFMKFCERLVCLVRLNLLWMLFCLPVFTAGAAQAALLSQLEQYRQGEDVRFRTFLADFRRHFRPCTLLWLFCLFLGVMLAADYRLVVYMDFPGRMAVICLICFAALLLLLSAGFLFPMAALHPDTPVNTLVNAVLLTLARLPKAFLILAARALPWLLAIAFPPAFVFLSFLLPTAGFSLIALYQLSVFRKALE